MSTDNEFDRMINRMTQGDPPHKQRSSSAGKFLSLISAITVVSFFGGLVIMVLNTVVNDAYPNLNYFEPGIGYWNATRLFFLGWVFFAILTGLKGMQKKS